MLEQLLAPLNWIIGIVDKLLIEENFNDMQRKFLFNIATGAHDLRSLLLTSAPVASLEKSREVMSFDGRSYLSAIIGYSEELLDEVEGELTDEQRDLLFEVRSSAMQLLSDLESSIEE